MSPPPADPEPTGLDTRPSRPTNGRPGATASPTARPAEGRRYGGRSTPQRRAERRGRLLAAGLQLFGTAGWLASPIERLCAQAGVATRSFYEEFAGREALLLAVYEQITAGAARAVRAALAEAPGDLRSRIPVGLAAYVDHLTSDPRRARVAHREVRTAGMLEGDRHAAVVAFAAMIEAEVQQGSQGSPTPAEGDRRLLALALAGAVNEVLVDWTAAHPRPDTASLTATLTRLFSAVLT